LPRQVAHEQHLDSANAMGSRRLVPGRVVAVATPFLGTPVPT
jgi:hypothetical protein